MKRFGITLGLVFILGASACSERASGPTSPTAGRVAAGTIGKIVPERLTLRSARNETAPAQAEVVAGDDAYVVEGPITIGSKTWLFLQVHPADESRSWTEPGLLGPAVWKGTWGWASTPEDAKAMIEPADPRCPSKPFDLSTLQSMWAAQRLACFGKADVSFRAWAIRPEGLGGFANDRDTPTWLNGAYGGAAFTLNANDEEPFWNERFLVWVSPSLTIDASLRRGWVQVTGHFDDPASSTCRKYGPVEAQTTASAWPFFDILACREHFVATAVEHASAP